MIQWLKYNYIIVIISFVASVYAKKIYLCNNMKSVYIN